MPPFKLKILSSLFQTAVKPPVNAVKRLKIAVKSNKPAKPNNTNAVKKPNAAKPNNDNAVQSYNAVKPDNAVKPEKMSSVSSIVGNAVTEQKMKLPSVKKQLRRKSLRKNTSSAAPVAESVSTAVNEEVASFAEEPGKESSGNISTILCGDTEMVLDDSADSQVADQDDELEGDANLPWFSNLFNNSTPLRRKELSRDRKNKWVFKNTQKIRFDKLVSLCLARLGSGSMFSVLTKLGRGTGLKEYNAFIRGCIETARNSKDEKVQIEQILESYRLLQVMKERGFPIEEEIFGPFLEYLIDKHMDDQFQLLLDIVKDEDPSLHPRLGYYEMLFWIEMKNEEKVREICNEIATGESEMGSLLHENYLLALCQKDRKVELLELLDIIDITGVSSIDNVAIIFRALGRLSLETFAELFISVLKNYDYGTQSISNLIYAYASSLKNLTVEEAILKFKEMHGKMDVSLVAGSYEQLITFCCDSLKVHLALDLVDEMCEAGLTLSVESLNGICHTCEETYEYALVRRIYSMLDRDELKPDGETYRSIINMNVRLKDFDNAYAMFKDLDKLNMRPSASMYNVILAGYYREKNMNGVLRVLKEMKEADVKPDSHTFSYLISNCTHEEDIVKYLDELKLAGVQATKYVYMALVNGYTSSGQFDRAKEVILDTGIPVKSLNEIKSALVSALAHHGKFDDALDIYEEMKNSGSCLEPKAVIALIENQRSKGKLGLQLRLLEELNDGSYWADACCRIVLYSIRNKDLRAAVDLLKKLADKFEDDELVQESIFDEVFTQIADMNPPDLQMGTDLVRAIREDLGLRPSRKCLDFLLGACVICKDLQKALLVWKEYELAGLPYNILSSLRMYQAYLASGHLDEATDFLETIPKDDAHVRSILHACRVTYVNTKVGTKKNKKKIKTQTQTQTRTRT